MLYIFHCASPIELPTATETSSRVARGRGAAVGEGSRQGSTAGWGGFTCTAAAGWPRWGGLCRILPHLLGGRKEAKNSPEGGLRRGATSTLPTPQPALGTGQQSGAVLLGQSPRGAPAL